MTSTRQAAGGVVAGLLDTGLASLATFAVGLAAIDVFSKAELGAYAIFFSAFVLATTLPTNLILLPVEVWLVGHPVTVRLGYLMRSLRWGGAAAVLSVLPYGLLVPIIGGGEVSDRVLIALWVSGTVAGLLSPLQDHMRRLFHVAGRHSFAAATSLAQLAGVVAALLALRAAGADPGWIPMGALAIANAFSLVVAVVLARLRPGPAPEEPLELRAVVRSGRWLLIQGVVPIGAGFVATGLVGAIAGLATLGLAEAARIVAQPLFVLGGGLNATLGPRSMEAGAGSDRARATWLRLAYWRLFVPLGLLYIAIVSWNVPLNPMHALVPRAFEVTGLVLVAGIGALFIGLSLPARSELLGLGEEKGLTRIDTIASAARVAAAGVTAAWLGAFSIHIGTIADGAVKTVARTNMADRKLAQAATSSAPSP